MSPHFEQVDGAGESALIQASKTVLPEDFYQKLRAFRVEYEQILGEAQKNHHPLTDQQKIELRKELFTKHGLTGSLTGETPQP